MDDASRQDLFDPEAARGLVLAHRPPLRSAVACVVPDVVWSEVVGLLRLATADPGGSEALRERTWWHLAVGCADLLRRLPRLSDEIEEAWTGVESVPPPISTSGPARIEEAGARLLALLRTPGAHPLPRLAVAVDALGAAAIGALAERAAETAAALR